MFLDFEICADFIQHNNQDEDAANNDEVPVDFPKDFHCDSPKFVCNERFDKFLPLIYKL